LRRGLPSQVILTYFTRVAALVVAATLF